MLRTKIFETYYPNLNSSGEINNNGTGKEYDLQEISNEQLTIDYDDYYHSTFDTFWKNFLNRYYYYKETKELNGELINVSVEISELEPESATYNEDYKNIVEAKLKANIQKLLLALYKTQENDKSNPYWCYVKMNDEQFYNPSADFKDAWSIDGWSDLSWIEFIINQNQYFEGKNVEEFSAEDNLGDYKDVDFYMGVNEFDDLNGQKVQMFHYYEFKKNASIKKVQHKISNIRIEAPLGTVFYLNRELHPIYVSKYANPWIIDTTKGIYTLELEDYLDLRYITFPKDAIPDYYQLDPNTGETIIDQNKMEELGWTVSYQYDDDYDITYEDK